MQSAAERRAKDVRAGQLGGWLGSQVGGSCWIAVAALATLHIPTASTGLAAIFAGMQLASWLLWRRRERSSERALYLSGIAVLAVGGAAAIGWAVRTGAWSTISDGFHPLAVLAFLFGICAVIAVLMVQRTARAPGQSS